ncbi:hypothetical protein J8F10_23985 [Gemmata sp. G18]|uniref:Uncharacterized protein n=1 Tax=Gemmata palustris TaxID=2822762 RepID=A0ABS5BXD2_9BACT|nr:hypothetical protein [Gemmata palustris]MBP3958320.1 hypothetical protein [Gemmata palustris]
MGSVLLTLNGSEMWAYVVATDEGLRLRLGIDDWQRLNLVPGSRVPMRESGKNEVWLFVTNVTEQPPVVWVTMARRVRVAG